MALSLRPGNYSGNDFEQKKTGQGLEAWEWVEGKTTRQSQAVDVALYSIQGPPNNCKKKA